MLPGELALFLMGIEPSQFSPGNDSIGFVEDQGSRFQISKEALLSRINHVLVSGGCVIGPSPAPILVIGRRKKEITFGRISIGSCGWHPVGIPVGFRKVLIDISEGTRDVWVPGFCKIDIGEQVERLA